MFKGYIHCIKHSTSFARLVVDSFELKFPVVFLTAQLTVLGLVCFDRQVMPNTGQIQRGNVSLETCSSGLCVSAIWTVDMMASHSNNLYCTASLGGDIHDLEVVNIRMVIILVIKTNLVVMQIVIQTYQ